MLPGTRGNNDSETTGHDIHPSYVEMMERGVNNQQKHLFLESNAVNEHYPFPQEPRQVLKSLLNYSQSFNSDEGGRKVAERKARFLSQSQSLAMQSNQEITLNGPKTRRRPC